MAAELQQDVSRRLLYILHLGFVEARLLALGKQHEQLFDLADAMEILPSFMDAWSDEHLEMIRFILRTYKDKYPQSTFDYLKYLEDSELPERF